MRLGPPLHLDGTGQTGIEPSPLPRGLSLSGPAPRKYRVLKVAPTSFFSDYGCHVRIYEETRWLQGAGHRVAICTYATGRDLPGLDIRRSPHLPWRQSPEIGSSLHKLYHDALLAATVQATTWRLRPDLVHAHLHEGALLGYAAARPLGIPLIFDFQGSLTREMLDHRFLQRKSRWFGALDALERVINRLPHLIVTSSANAADLLVNEFNVAPHRVETLPDAVDTERFRPRVEVDAPEMDELRYGLGIEPGVPVVAYLGLLAEYQGVGKLLEAARLLKGRGVTAHWLIMGYPGADFYRDLAGRLEIADVVTFTGRVAYERAPSLLRLADVAVSPKISETEGNGKLLTYMSSGIATVAFDTPVAHELLGDLGIFARLGDAASLADAIQSLVKDPKGARQLGFKLRDRAKERFSLSLQGAALTQVYSHVCR